MPSISVDWLRHRTTLEGGDTARGNVFRCSFLESKTKLSVAKAQDHIEGNNTQKKHILGRGDTTDTFLIG